jgi:hypothetical protein
MNVLVCGTSNYKHYSKCHIFLVVQQTPVGQCFIHCRNFMITIGRIPLDELSARSRDLYLTANNNHRRQTPVGFEPAIPAGERPQTHGLYLSGRVIRQKQRPLPDSKQQSQETDPGGIRTCNPSKRASTDPRFIPNGHRDRPKCDLAI